MKRDRWVGWLAAVLAAAFLSACNGGDPGDDGTGPERIRRLSGGTAILWNPGSGGVSGVKYHSSFASAWDTCHAWGSVSNPCVNVTKESSGCNPGVYSCSYRYYFQSGLQIGNLGITANASGYTRGSAADPDGTGRPCTKRTFSTGVAIMCYTKDVGGNTHWSGYWDAGSGLGPRLQGFSHCYYVGVGQPWTCLNVDLFQPGPGTWYGSDVLMPQLGLQTPSGSDPEEIEFEDWLLNDQA